MSIGIIILIAVIVLLNMVSDILLIIKVNSLITRPKYRVKVKPMMAEKTELATTENRLLDELEEFVEIGYMWHDLIDKKELLEWIKEKRRKYYE